nr:SBBP repeat-containing protein [uncultured Paludibaculum sp.]
MSKDAQGNLFAAGMSTSADFKATAGAAADERGDVFVQKIKANRSGVLWTAKLGGSKAEEATAIAVDDKGDVYIAGWTTSTDFPTSTEAFQRFSAGAENGFVAKLSGKDGSLVYCTYLGGEDDDELYGISVNSTGVVAVTGHTDSTNFPTQAAASRSAFSSGPGAIIARLDAKGAKLVSSTVLGGNGWVEGNAIVILPDGTLQLAGSTSASDLLMVKSWQKNHQSAGVWRSGDAGVSWAASADGMRGAEGKSIALDPTNPQILYVATGRGVFKSTDGGVTWIASSSGMTSASAQYVVVDPITPTTVYVATATGGAFKSTDGGSNWTGANVGLGKSVWQLAIDPKTPTTLYATTNTNGIMKSTDAGATWSSANIGINKYYPYLYQVAVDPKTPETLFAAGYLGVYRSRDAGATWTMLNAGPMDEVYTAVYIDPSDSNTVYASSIFTGSYRSNDGGASWRSMRGGMPPFFPAFEFRAHPAIPGVVYAATQLGIYKSLDYGQTWSEPAAELTYQYIYGLALNPLDKNIVYSCGQLAGDGFLFHMDKDGQSVLQSTYLGGSGDDEVYAMTVGSDGSVYVAGETESDDFPTTSGAPQTAIGGDYDAFAAKLEAGTGALAFSTLLGGNSTDVATHLAVEPNGLLAVTGWTGSRDFPATAGVGDLPLGGASDAFLARVSTLAPGFSLATLIGGSGMEYSGAVVSTDKGPLIGGYTNSRDLTGTLPALSTSYLGGVADGFVAGVSGLSAPATVQQTSLTFEILLDGSPLTAEKTVVVTSPAGGLPLEGKVLTDAPWVRAVPNPTAAGELIVKVDASGLAAGEYTATIEVSSPLAGVPATPVQITLRVTNPTPPSLTAAGVLHQAERTSQAIAPGLPILLQGEGFAFSGPLMPADPAVDLPTTLAGVTVTVNGTPAALESVQSTFISAIVPFGVTGDTATIVVNRGNLASEPIVIPLAPTAPGLFTADGSGQGQARAENEDRSTNTADNPAEHGRPVILYAIGGGVMTPALADGQIVHDADHKPEATVEVFIGGLPCDVYYWGNTPGQTAGYLTLNLKVPDDVTPGPAVPVVLRIGGKDSTQTVTIAVR